jgi:hypothetical protein
MGKELLIPVSAATTFQTFLISPPSLRGYDARR